MIHQINGNTRMQTYKTLGALLQEVVYGDGATIGSQQAHHLLQQVLKNTAINRNVDKTKNAKDRRVHWTNYKNISMRFDNWEHDLVALRTAHVDPITNEVCIPEEQLRNIANLDEMNVSLDGSTASHGGQPEMVLYDPRFPQVGKAMTKTVFTMTMITRSNAAGEALPPHLQFPMKAKSNDMMQLDYDMVEFMWLVRGQFGCKEERCWPVTFGQNKKRGMDEEEFAAYIMNSIVPLYPNAKDKSGHQVILKVDSGPGRMNMDFLAKLKMLGFILYPCVPNTTHVTQETDQNYGPFKTQFNINLELIVVAQLRAEESLSLQPKFVGLPLFGGVDRDTECEVQVGAFNKGFNREWCLAAWSKISTATKEGKITRNCLSGKQVLKFLGDGDEDNSG
jgi:hypothetical protein